jgi:hypothetical protein
MRHRFQIEQYCWLGAEFVKRNETFGKAEGRTADPSTTLRSGRDDKGEGIAFHLHRTDRMDKAELSIPSQLYTN